MFEALANIMCMCEYLMYMFKNLMRMFQFVKILEVKFLLRYNRGDVILN